jgi:hypothetical protein
MAGIDGWRECLKCLGLFSEDNPGTCAAGGQHNDGGTSDHPRKSYRLMTDARAGVSDQPNWFDCRRCSLLFWKPRDEREKTWCPAGGGHDWLGSLGYYLDPHHHLSDPTHSRGWFRCDGCGALSHGHAEMGPHADMGPEDNTWGGWCPAGGSHQSSFKVDDHTYELFPSPPITPEQSSEPDGS